MMKQLTSGDYAPFILFKQGEKKALEVLPSSSKAGLSPIFAIPTIDWDFDEDRPKKTVSDHLKDVPGALYKAWGPREAFVDLSLVYDGPASMSDGTHPISWLDSQSSAEGCGELTFVTRPDRPQSEKQEIAGLLADPRRDAAVRLEPDFWSLAAGFGPIDQLLSDLGVGAERVHLILDVGDEIVTTSKILVAGELRSMQGARNWKSIILAGTGIPTENPQGVGQHVIPRLEWNLFKDVKQLALVNDPDMPFVLCFSDYGVSGRGTGVDVDPRFMSISAMFRYTCQDHWVFAKGKLFKGPNSTGALAMSPPAYDLVNGAHFQPGHCDAEDWLVDVAANIVPGTNTTSGGNPSVWRRWATLHHLEVTLKQVANYYATSVSP